MVHTLLHISDLHFGPPLIPAAVEAVHEAAHEIRPDLVVCSGDLVQWPRQRAAWAGVQSFLERFAAPTLVVPGNHDLAMSKLVQRFTSPFSLYREYIREEVDHLYERVGVLAVGLCVPKRVNLDLGFLARSQLDWARSAFSKVTAETLKVVVVHQAVRQVAHPRTRNRFWGAERALQSWLGMGVDLILSGHCHFPRTELLGEGDHRILWSQAGTACSRRYIHPDFRRCSFTVIRSTERRHETEWWFFDPDKGRFAPEITQEFLRHHAGGPV